jgi:prepilin-type N-terminal cleavage/methylation domain-containing protein
MPCFRPQRQTITGPEPAERGFTIVEVMMASVILVVGFMGMIEAVTVTSGMMDHARRQALANQIINHEIENLRVLSWDITGSTNDLLGLPTASTTVAIAPQFWPTWNNKTAYVANSVITYNGAWYRCILAHTGQTPPNATYWTSVTAGATTDIVNFSGATYTLARSVTSPDPTTYIREVTFTVTWVVTTSRQDTGGSLLTFTYTRSNSAWFGKYGLNLSHQRS